MTSETDDTGVHHRLRFNVLGALEIRDRNEPVLINGAVRRRTLTVLLLEAGRVVPVPRLVEAAWDEDPPGSAAHQIRKAVAELRRRIPGGAAVIHTDGPGYRISVAPGQLDLLRYQDLLRAAQTAQENGEPDLAVTRLRSALELWRGPVLAGEGGRVVDAASTALEEQRLGAAERLYELAIEAGEAAAVIGELRALAAQYPLRETLRGRLMLALYHTGQQAAALDEFNRIRDLLDEDLGIAPSAELCELQAHILRQEPSLAPARRGAARAGTAPPAAVVPQALPFDVPDFSGRAVELERIHAVVEHTPPGTPTVIAVDGMGGGGKTALAVRAAHQLAHRYPDGQLFVDLRGFTPGQEPLSAFRAQGDLLAAAGICSEEIPGVPAGRHALWQSYMRGRRMLLVLDNADTAEQVRPLVPASPDSLTLITSRPRLTDLDGVEWLSLGALPEPDSHEILRHTLGGERLEREADAAAELLRLCGGLPLAVRIAAARLSNRPRWTVQHLVDRLRDHGRRLDELSSEDRGVAGALSLSYESMPRQDRRAFRLLGHHPGRYIDVEEAGALLGRGTTDAEDVLERLVDVRLLEAREPGAYAFHDLVRHFARRLAQGEPGPEDTDAVERLLDHYLARAENAGDTLFPGRTRYSGPNGGPPGTLPAFRTRDAALKWLDQHRDSLLAAVDMARGHGLLRHAGRLPRELGFHSSIRSYDLEANVALETGVGAAQTLADPALTRLNLTNLAMGQWRLGRIREAVARLEDALDISRSMDDARSTAECKARLGQAYNSLGELRHALKLSEEANRTARATGFARLDGSSLSTMSHVRARLGQFDEAVEAARQALVVFDSIGEIQLSVDALAYLSRALEGTGRHEEALGRADEAVERCEQLRMPSVLPVMLARRADVLLRMGRTASARESALHALAEAVRSTDDIHRATVHLSAARAHQAGGDFPAALRQNRLALDIASQMELRYEEAEALSGLAAACGASGDDDAAAAYRGAGDLLYSRMGVPESLYRPS
ncbi:AfsR/SARP family transcriptional regulator [Streptomyces peucetius]|uniref:NB-ARC domain-containing protein n=1 Tax=Streptomyces peucetius TaxID=1950 RepID=A0ABY6I7Q6_STRPE|nr:BTAD domain-containing putative transcriptional regulator [Streptomyces peucetius]UYQ63026.1 NB-ARC domain-containing protein [Streptomyces peucetius]